MPDASPAIRFPPPLVFLGFVLLGPVVDRALGLPSLIAPWWLAAAPVIGGIVPILIAVRGFRRRGEDPTPWTPTKAVMTSGVYGFTRNPMYLGMAIVAVGLAALLHSWSALALVPFAILAIERWVIRPEEAYLRATFGDAYAGYCHTVPRWI